ncbi:hypothetical protein PVAP13_3NG181236 [Panicum virgatum]|uniref:Uncharacterized protein n=1 Tax=Panicum virgatum TaxID=38727 RepID=A0A8T0U8V8_PANVG|nr:hypothetical protein PVAP13_3NG181236 [Panicum virgatum]
MTPNGGDDDGGVRGEAFGLEEHDTEAGGELGEEVLGGEGEDGARVGDLLGDLGGRVERVGGGEHSTEGHGGERSDGEVDGVGGHGGERGDGEVHEVGEESKEGGDERKKEGRGILVQKF